MSNTPSDAEIEKLAAEHLKAFSQFPMGGQVWFEGEVEFARAVLARWGSPPPVGREPLSDEVESEVRKQDEALIHNFVAAIKLDRHDWEDWPEDSRKAFEALRAAQEDKSHDN